MLMRDDFHGIPTLYRAPIVFATMPMLPRPPLDCAECHKPLPLIRGANVVAHSDACQKARTRRTMARANARRKVKKLKEREQRGNIQL